MRRAFIWFMREWQVRAIRRDLAAMRERLGR